MTYLLTFFTSILLAMLVTPGAISLSRDWGLMDHPDTRKHHDTAMPLAGGLVLFPFVLAAILISFRGQGSLLHFLSGTTLIFVMGLWDDRFGAHFSTKFLVQIVAALIVMQSGLFFDLNRVVPLVGMGLEIGHFFSMAVTLLWIIGVTNAVNIIDGMDGLAAGLCFNAFAGMGAIALVSGSYGLSVFCLIMSGALLGVLRYNIYPARTFLGDSGSMLLGFTLAVLSLVQSSKTAAFLMIVVPVLLLALPMLDTAFAFARRGIKGRNPFKADRGHLHHRLLDLNFTPRQALGIFFSLSTGMGCLALWLAQTRQVHVLNVAVSLMVLALAAVKAMQIFNFHGAIRNLNRRMRIMARKAIDHKRSTEERLLKNFVTFTVLSVLNLILALTGTEKSFLVAASVVGIFAVGVVDYILARRSGEARYETIHLVLFLSLVVNQLTILVFWHRDYLLTPYFVVSAFLVLILLAFVIYRTGTFAVFLQDPMEILALYSGIILCGIAKHFVGTRMVMPFAVVLVNALVLYTLLKIYLSGYRMRSWTYFFGFAACVAILLSVPWWG